MRKYTLLSNTEAVQVVSARVVAPVCSASPSPASARACLEHFSSQLRRENATNFCLHYLATDTDFWGGRVGSGH